jgi:hypothetical protein
LASLNSSSRQNRFLLCHQILNIKFLTPKTKTKRAKGKWKKHNFPQNEKVILGRQKMRNGPAGVK